jgi:hypothetical protein
MIRAVVSFRILLANSLPPSSRRRGEATIAKTLATKLLAGKRSVCQAVADLIWLTRARLADVSW